MRPSGHTAVMASRTEAPDSLDFFPTPPWSTRAFLPILKALDPEFERASVWEPACGEGHMAAVLAEAAARVLASDVFDYGAGAVGDFLDTVHGPHAGRVDWIITNPPFKTAAQFAEVGLARAQRGVALLVRTAWLEGGYRFDRLFSRRPPRLIAQYAERVPMTKGRWDPEATTATAYCWVVWTSGELDTGEPTQFRWIPLGQRKRLSTADDIARFAARRASPSLDEATA